MRFDIPDSISGDFGHRTGWPCQRLCRGEQADVSTVKEFVGVLGKVKGGKGNVPTLVDGSQQLEQFPFSATQGPKGAQAAQHRHGNICCGNKPKVL